MCVLNKLIVFFFYLTYAYLDSSIMNRIKLLYVPEI